MSPLPYQTTGVLTCFTFCSHPLCVWVFFPLKTSAVPFLNTVQAKVPFASPEGLITPHTY